MEKTQLLGGSIALPLQGRVKTRRNPLTLFFISLLSITALFHFFRSNTSSSANKEEIVLGKLIPTECWSSSFEKPFKCYHLYAPLDYLNETDERTARLAVATYPAGGGKTKKGDILGTLLLNPGEYIEAFLLPTSHLTFDSTRWSGRQWPGVHFAGRLTRPIQDKYSSSI